MWPSGPGIGHMRHAPIAADEMGGPPRILLEWGLRTRSGQQTRAKPPSRQYESPMVGLPAPLHIRITKIWNRPPPGGPCRPGQTFPFSRVPRPALINRALSATQGEIGLAPNPPCRARRPVLGCWRPSAVKIGPRAAAIGNSCPQGSGGCPTSPTKKNRGKIE